MKFLSRVVWSEGKHLGPHADMHDFSISLIGACWQHILQTKHVGVYVPGDLGYATFELTIITETSA
jgi:type VI secretion system protein ImpJ